MATRVLIFAFFALVFSQAFASDPSPLQDFCVADNTSQIVVNGFVCKNPDLVTVNDFFLTAGFDKPGNTNNNVGSNVNLVSASNLPGLNTLGISLARLDFAPDGLIVPHYHPRATEVLTVLQGTLYVGFVSTSNQLFAKVLNQGDVYVFPQGMIHFQFNKGHGNAVAISGLSSQNPGLVLIANSVFGANPPISDDVLAKAFMLDKKTVDWLQAKFKTD